VHGLNLEEGVGGRGQGKTRHSEGPVSQPGGEYGGGKKSFLAMGGASKGKSGYSTSGEGRSRRTTKRKGGGGGGRRILEHRKVIHLAEEGARKNSFEEIREKEKS